MTGGSGGTAFLGCASVFGLDRFASRWIKRTYQTDPVASQDRETVRIVRRWGRQTRRNVHSSSVLARGARPCMRGGGRPDGRHLLPHRAGESGQLQ